MAFWALGRPSRSCMLCTVCRHAVHRVLYTRRGPRVVYISSISFICLVLYPQGLESLLAQRRLVDSELSSLVGMASLKSFLADLRAKVEYVHSGGDPRLLEGCLNVILTGAVSKVMLLGICYLVSEINVILTGGYGPGATLENAKRNTVERLPHV